MCKASQDAENVIDVAKGKTYGIGISAYHLASLHPQGQTAAQCVACAKTGTSLVLIGIPSALQEEHGIGSVLASTFMQTGHNTQDMIAFKDRNGAEKKVSLSRFANHNIAAFVGTLADLKQMRAEKTIADLLDKANAGAAVFEEELADANTSSDEHPRPSAATFGKRLVTAACVGMIALLPVAGRYLT